MCRLDADKRTIVTAPVTPVAAHHRLEEMRIHLARFHFRGVDSPHTRSALCACRRDCSVTRRRCAFPLSQNQN